MHLFSYKKENTSISNEQKTSATTSIYFPNYNLNNVYKYNDNKISTTYSCTYFDSSGTQIFRDIYLNDTIYISDSNTIINFHLVYKGIELVSYWLKQGLDYQLEIKNELPVLSILYKTIDSTDIYTINKLILVPEKEFFSAYSLITKPIGFSVLSEMTGQSLTIMLEKAKTELFNSAVLKLTQDSIYLVNNLVNPTLLKNYQADIEFKKMNIFKDIDVLHYWKNEYFYNLFYRTDVFGLMNSNTYINNYNNIKFHFEKIINNNNIPSSHKDVLLIQYLENCLSNGKIELIDSMKQYINYIENSHSKFLIKSKYDTLNVRENDLVLLNSKKDTILFSNLLKIGSSGISNGSIKYIDFWASWCAPCRQAMPASAKLRSKYKDKNLEFVYLALNDKEEKWNDASQKENLFNLTHNYFIVNSKSSSLLNELKVNTIPRYMIYDKNGKLIDSNAPGPDDPKLISILNKLLK